MTRLSVDGLKLGYPFFDYIDHFEMLYKTAEFN